MQFFQQLHDLELVGDLKIVITRSAENAMLVSVLLNNAKCGDQAAATIAPMLLKGSPADLDEGFFERIGEPMRQTSGLMVDMEAYLKNVEEAKKQSAMAKANATPTPAKPVIDSKTVAYTNAMKKVQELIDAKKYKDAIGKLPDAKDHPAKKTIIEERKKWLMQMALDGGGMFPQPYPKDEEESKPVVATPAAEVAESTDAEVPDDDESEEEEEETELVNED